MVDLYLEDLSRYPLLSPAEEDATARRARAGDQRHLAVANEVERGLRRLHERRFRRRASQRSSAPAAAKTPTPPGSGSE